MEFQQRGTKQSLIRSKNELTPTSMEKRFYSSLSATEFPTRCFPIFLRLGGDQKESIRPDSEQNSSLSAKKFPTRCYPDFPRLDGEQK